MSNEPVKLFLHLTSNVFFSIFLKAWIDLQKNVLTRKKSFSGKSCKKWFHNTLYWTLTVMMKQKKITKSLLYISKKNFCSRRDLWNGFKVRLTIIRIAFTFFSAATFRLQSVRLIWIFWKNCSWQNWNWIRPDMP